jgi:intein-encoded DNA endonuclease-like protein
MVVMGTAMVTKAVVEDPEVGLRSILGIMRIMMGYMKLMVDLAMRNTVQLEPYTIIIWCQRM